MAPRKRKATASLSQANYDSSRFVSRDAWGRYADNILSRNILPERNVKLYIPEFHDFRREVERRNWHRELTNFSKGSIDVAVVKEFYANIYVPKDKEPSV